MVTRQQIKLMRERITDEIFFALGLKKTGWLRHALGWLFYLPTYRFSRIFATADEVTGQNGISAGCRSVVNDLAIRLQVRGADRIPREGPLLVIANHPGAYDSVAIGSCIPRRDLEIIVYEIPFYRALPHISQRLIFATNEPTGRMLALRRAIRHLQSGGAVLQFGSGTIEPDPATQPGAEAALARWSPSVEIMLHKIPQTSVVLVIVSGVLLRRFADHPLTRIHRNPVDQRRLAEFMQVIQQLILPKSVPAAAQVSFAAPVTVAELVEGSSSSQLFPALLNCARNLLQEHRMAWNLREDRNFHGLDREKG